MIDDIVRQSLPPVMATVITGQAHPMPVATYELIWKTLSLIEIDFQALPY